MLIVIANDLPPAVRGRMKLWFIEVRANVFVSGLKDHTAKKVIEYLFAYCQPSAGLLILNSIRKPPGYKIYRLGDTRNALIQISGLQLIAEKLLSTDDTAEKSSDSMDKK